MIDTYEMRAIAKRMAARNPGNREIATLRAAADILDRWPQGRMGSTIERTPQPEAHIRACARDEMTGLVARVEKLEAEVFKPFTRHAGPMYRFPNGVQSCSHCGQEWNRGPFCAR